MSLMSIIIIALIFLSILFAIFIVILFMGVRGIQKESKLLEVSKISKTKMRFGPENLIKATDALINLQIRNFMELKEFDKLKPIVHERYRRQMTELEFERFLSYLTEDDLRRVDIGIKGLDGLADPRAIPELDQFIQEKKDKKEFGELVERAKSVRDRTVELSR